MTDVTTQVPLPSKIPFTDYTNSYLEIHPTSTNRSEQAGNKQNKGSPAKPPTETKYPQGVNTCTPTEHAKRVHKHPTELGAGLGTVLGATVAGWSWKLLNGVWDVDADRQPGVLVESPFFFCEEWRSITGV